MLPLGRPRHRRQDLPPGLHYKPEKDAYYLLPTKFNAEGKRPMRWLGKITREQAIDEWLKARRPQDPEPIAGTVAELVERFFDDELPREERLAKVRKITADEYRRQRAALVAWCGARLYAPTAAQSTDPRYFRTVDVLMHMRKFEGQRGAVAANRRVALLSRIFSYAAKISVCTYNPCVGADRNPETPRKNVLADDVRERIFAAADPALRLIARMSDLTSLRKTDIRNLTLPQIREGVISVKQSKTGKEQEFEITPAVADVLEKAAKLPGRARSLFVFPTRKGTAFTESGLQSAWRRACAKAGIESGTATFRDFRTTELNAIKREGGDATAAAGHADKRTTDRHYINVPTRVRPRR